MSAALERGFEYKRLARCCIFSALCLVLAISQGRAIACSIDFPIHHQFIYFAPSESVLSPLAISFLENVYDEYRSNEVVAILICGHSDQASNVDVNMELSKRRAEIVGEKLIALGVDPNIVQLCWRGEWEPSVDVGDNAAEPNNRRVEILMYF